MIIKSYSLSAIKILVSKMVFCFFYYLCNRNELFSNLSGFTAV